VTNPFAAAANNAAATSAPAAASMATASGNANAPETTAPAGNLSDMFSTDVSSGDMAKLKADLGAAVLVRPTEWIESMKTVNGDTSAIRADWIVLDGPNQGALRSNSLVFNTVVRNTLKNVLDGPYPFFVGVVAEGEAKPGKNAPLVFATAAPEQVKLAEQAAQAHGWL
jgi:hypothetical protein